MISHTFAVADPVIRALSARVRDVSAAAGAAVLVVAVADAAGTCVSALASGRAHAATDRIERATASGFSFIWKGRGRLGKRLTPAGGTRLAPLGAARTRSGLIED